MSIISEIERLEAAKLTLSNAITAKGVTMPAGITMNRMAELVNDIPVGADVSGVTATASDVFVGVKFVDANGNEVIGTMANNGAVSQTLNTSTTSYTVPAGYHNGSGKVSMTTETKTATPSTSEQSITPSSGKVLSQVTVLGDANLKSENIVSGVSIFGVAGSYTGEDLSTVISNINTIIG